MTVPGVGILREPDVGATDVAGLLPAAAAAGAQVRSVLDASASLPAIDRPRAMVVVGGDAEGDTAFLTALVGANSPAPIVGAPFLPPWVGPLDLVVVLASRADDESAAESAGIARRRGATTIVRAAETGPVAEAAGPSLIAPVVAVPEALSVSARWSLLAVVAARAGLAQRVDLARTADLLDAISLACHPGAETFLNPGVNLAEYLGEGTPLLIGCDRLGDAIARHGASVLADLGGVAAGVLTAEQAALSPGLLRRAAAGKDLFADPFDDGPSTQQIKPLLVSTAPEGGPGGRTTRAAADRMVLAGLLRSFSGAMHLDGSPDSLPAVAGPADWSTQDTRFGGSGPDYGTPAGQPADAFDAAVAACVRLDFAAVYVGIATGQLVPLDFPDGLGRVGGTRWAVRPATVGGSREREQGMDTWN
ncbi:hypothetical protein ABIB25_003926 [Nakamurella sp. UYEF19]|uniref:hypothetical protein n=1 Tax=Nakamurella sp. UYEF19 TaxID=1756392 RepID=UPI0033953ED2